jgi:sodium-dependent dicarboxylate transporter 2/3/5
VALTVICWLTEALPLPVTALLGCALAVLLGIAPAATVLGAFGDPVIFLFIGSFMLARGLQVHGVDRRIAYTLLAHPWVGGSATRTLLALGLVAWALSMWMSNTACAAMLFPVALAIARTTDDPRYATGLLLMLAYAASIGGLATPVGTPPNLIGIALIEQATGARIGFLSWMAVGVPVALILLAALCGIILWLFRPSARSIPGQRQRMAQQQEALGPLSRGERNSLLAFGAAIALWVGPGLPGLWLGADHPLVRALAERLPEGVAALLAASLLFVLPINWRARAFTLRWEDAARIDWGTVLLFGGGIALGRMMFDTGLAQALGQGVVEASGLARLEALAGAAAATAALLSETSSNTASANTVVPVMLSVAQTMGASRVVIGVAATMGASLGFMLPVSTPPNAIVYGSGSVRIADMVKAGLLLDLVGVAVVWAASLWLAPRVL